VCPARLDNFKQSIYCRAKAFSTQHSTPVNENPAAAEAVAEAAAEAAAAAKRD